MDEVLTFYEAITPQPLENKREKLFCQGLESPSVAIIFLTKIPGGARNNPYFELISRFFRQFPH
jgi:hypothetical protein